MQNWFALLKSWPGEHSSTLANDAMRKRPALSVKCALREKCAVLHVLCEVCSVQFAVCSVQCVVCPMQLVESSVQCAMGSVHCAVLSVEWAVCSLQFTVCSVQYSVCSVLCVVYNVQCSVCSMQCAVCCMQCVGQWCKEGNCHCDRYSYEKNDFPKVRPTRQQETQIEVWHLLSLSIRVIFWIGTNTDTIQPSLLLHPTIKILIKRPKNGGGVGFCVYQYHERI